MDNRSLDEVLRTLQPAMGGYNFTSHKGENASWVGRGDAHDWIALDPWGHQSRGHATRKVAVQWCRAQTKHPDPTGMRAVVTELRFAARHRNSHDVTAIADVLEMWLDGKQTPHYHPLALMWFSGAFSAAKRARIADDPLCERHGQEPIDPWKAQQQALAADAANVLDESVEDDALISGIPN